MFLCAAQEEGIGGAVKAQKSETINPLNPRFNCS